MLLEELHIPQEISDLQIKLKLNTMETMLLTSIKALDKGEGCNAKNKYLATFFKVSESTIQKTIAKLVKRGLIKITNPKSWERKIYYKGLATEQPNNDNSGSTTVADTKVNDDLATGQANEIKSVQDNQTKQEIKPVHNDKQISKQDDKQQGKTAHRQIGHMSKNAQKFTEMDSREWDFDEIERLEREYIERKLNGGN